MAPRISLALFLSLNLLFFTYTSAQGSCPKDSLQISLCANVLNVVELTLGNPSVPPCCSLIDGLVDLEAAACLCSALKADILGITSINLPIFLNVLLNVCGRPTPTSYHCVYWILQTYKDIPKRQKYRMVSKSWTYCVVFLFLIISDCFCDFLGLNKMMNVTFSCNNVLWGLCV